MRSGVGWDHALFLCAKDCKAGEKTAHEFVSEMGEYNDIYEVGCLECKATQRVRRHEWLSQLCRDYIRPSKANLTKFPYVDPFTGETVHSKEHRSETWKRYGMHEAPHGIDDRYSENQECENLKNKRIASERWKRERDEKRKAFGRAPVWTKRS